MRKLISVTLAMILLSTSGAQAGALGGPDANSLAIGNSKLGTIHLQNGRAEFSRTNNLVYIDTYIGESSDPAWSHSISINTMNAVHEKWSMQKEMETKILNLHGVCGTLLSLGTGVLSGALFNKLLTADTGLPTVGILSDPLVAYAISVMWGAGVAVITAVGYSNFNKSNSTATRTELPFVENIRNSSERYGTTLTLEELSVQEFVSTLARLHLIDHNDILY